MYSQLCDLEAEESQKNESYVDATQNQLINTSLYKSKLNFLRNTYKIQDSIKMHKFSLESNDWADQTLSELSVRQHALS